ncbi:MAG: 3-hydroxybutyryl-CoA dehydrogenase, partial [Desulfurella sp.]|uniref:3-hydroxyacyl-CoA dehydrogenase family protein n=1 Tax=Desulfurella sp. TaxID=1962857 RepID=UPI000CB901E7
LARALDKNPALSKDYPGFIVNRVLIPMINEAIYAYYEGIASIEDIDKAMKLGTNQPMGPFVLADFIGLDTVLAIQNVLYEGFKDSKYRPCPLLVKMVEAGYLGRKSGKGFYDYTKK